MSNIASEFKNIGVNSVYFGSGARNASLLEDLKDFNIILGLDERSLAFQALGESILTNTPVVVCVTSGTAVAECLPAVIEAFYSHNKLIILSADRPIRLKNTRAPQTIEQDGIFKDFIMSKYSLTIEKFKLQEIKFPCHINLYIDDVDLKPKNTGIEKINESDLFDLCSNSKRALLVITHGTKLSLEELKILDGLSIDIFIEATSNISLNKKTPLYQDKTILDIMISDNPYDLVLKLGRTPTSKLWRELDFKFDTTVVSLNNSYIGIARGFYTNKNYISSLVFKSNHLNAKDKSFSDLINKYSQCELSIINKILSKIPSDDYVYIGNSMPIRYLQMLSPHEFKVFASRGANGIDGQLSTAIGIARATNKTVHCVIGDLTFLYDISVSFLPLPRNIKFHIINNKGGRIFERVNVSNKQILEHDIDFNIFIKNMSNFFEYNPSNDETERFWKEYNLL